MYITYDKFTGRVLDPYTSYRKEGCLEISDDEYNALSHHLKYYVIHNNKLIKKDNILRLNFEDVETEIPYSLETSELKLYIHKQFCCIRPKISLPLGLIVDRSKIDTLEVDNPIIEIFVYNKSQLIDTLLLNLNTYFRKPLYEIDISNILNKNKLTDLIFKTKRCVKTCSYQIVDKDSFFDRNLEMTDYSYHIKLNQTSRNELVATHNIKFWEEFADIIGRRIVIGFVENNNPNYLEHYIILNLKTLKEQDKLVFFIPDNVSLEDKTLFNKFNKLKIKYENTSN